MGMGSIQIAVGGLGRRARKRFITHIRDHLDIWDFVAACDPSSDAKATFNSLDVDGSIFEDVPSMLEWSRQNKSIHVAYVAIPHFVYLDINKLLLEAGIHIPKGETCGNIGQLAAAIP